MMLCLNGAAKITHRAQRIIGIVSQWHALATCNPLAVTDSSKTGDGDVNDPSQWSSTMRGPAHPRLYNDSSDELDSDEESPRLSTTINQTLHDIESFQKRHALGASHIHISFSNLSAYKFQTIDPSPSWSDHMTFSSVDSTSSLKVG